MHRPLSPDICDTSRPPDSWWRASAGEWSGPSPLQGDLKTDVAIIGGGYAGLSCAIRLAEIGIEASVLEAGEIGWGASGRNGGIVGLASHKLSDALMVRRYGKAEVARTTALQIEGQARLRAFMGENGLADAMQGDREVILAHSESAFRSLRNQKLPDGVTADIIEPSATGDMRRWGGVRIGPSFGVHPLRLVRALADHAKATGARVFAQSEVTSLSTKGGQFALRTARGSVTAHKLVLATNGFTPDGLHPAFDGRAVPVISNIGVTRPLSDEERARHAWLGDDPVADTRNLLVYLRLLPDGRLLFGMRGDLTGSDRGARIMKDRVKQRIAEQFPRWRGIPLDYFWHGPICATARYTPSIGHVKDLPNAFVSFGWHGSGINGAQVGGRLVAELAAGGSENAIPAPWRGEAPRLPLPGLRPLYVGAALLQQRVADALS